MTDYYISYVEHIIIEAIIRGYCKTSPFCSSPFPISACISELIIFLGRLLFHQFLQFGLFGYFRFKSVGCDPVIGLPFSLNEGKEFSDIVSQANQHTF